MRTLIPLLLSLLIAAPAGAEDADELELPHGLSWCQPRAESLSQFEEPQELSEDMVDATGSFAGIDGFYRMFFEEERLISVRFRYFEDAADNEKAIKSLTATLGAGIDTARATVWKPGGGQTVSFKGQSEQMYIDYEVPFERCTSGGLSLETTEQEKAELEAMKKKADPVMDPYSMDDDPDKQLVENKKKKKEEEKKKEEKKKDAKVKDVDIDW